MNIMLVSFVTECTKEIDGKRPSGQRVISILGQFLTEASCTYQHWRYYLWEVKQESAVESGGAKPIVCLLRSVRAITRSQYCFLTAIGVSI